MRHMEFEKETITHLRNAAVNAITAFEVAPTDGET